VASDAPAAQYRSPNRELRPDAQDNQGFGTSPVELELRKERRCRRIGLLAFRDSLHGTIEFLVVGKEKESVA
jgi:hypothetical protein